MLHQADDISTGVNLLISILVRYPEIGTIRFNPTNNALEMTFMLSQLPKGDISSIKKLLHDSIQTYHLLQKKQAESIDITVNSFDEISLLTVVRDVNTLSKGELELAINLLHHKFTDTLIVDINDFMPEEDLIIQEDLIDNMLQTIKSQECKKLLGIREDGRVLVFNK